MAYILGRVPDTSTGQSELILLMLSRFTYEDTCWTITVRVNSPAPISWAIIGTADGYMRYTN